VGFVDTATTLWRDFAGFDDAQREIVVHFFVNLEPGRWTGCRERSA